MKEYSLGYVVRYGDESNESAVASIKWATVEEAKKTSRDVPFPISAILEVFVREVDVNNIPPKVRQAPLLSRACL